jgi:uracil-DNA glycosylase
MFFRRPYEVVTGAQWEAGSAAVAAFWDNVYFADYIQGFVGNRPGIRPTPAMIEASHAPFFATLEALGPESILVLGDGVWNWMTPGSAPGQALPGGVGETRWYPAGERRHALAAHIPHPASHGFSSARWRQPVGEFLDLCRREKTGQEGEYVHRLRSGTPPRDCLPS